jgi:hypothetical protein
MSVGGATSTIAFRMFALSPGAGGSTMSVAGVIDLNRPIAVPFTDGRFG